MKTADAIIELLYDRGGFVALNELTAAAKTHRAGLDRALQELGRRGHEFEFVPAQGLRLVRPARLDSHLIERLLHGRRVGRNVICFRQVASTNDVAFDSARQPDADGLVVLAQHQSAGRGRLGRRWVSAPRTGILMSVLLVDENLPHEALTIAAGLAVAEGVQAGCGAACRLKWPNDVLLDGAKLAGVLVEVRRAQGRRRLVVGVGLNVNAAPPAAEVDGPATCLAEHLGHPLERNELAAALLKKLDDRVAAIAAGRLEELHKAWLAHCDMLNRRIRLQDGEATHEGRVLDVDPMEGLVLCLDDGRHVHVPARGATVLP